MEYPNDLLYTKEHEWIRLEGDAALVGISDYAQDQLGDVVFVELPNVGARLEVNAALASLESVKAVSEVFMPKSGTVLEVNRILEASPEQLNENPYGSWIARIAFDAPVAAGEFMDADAYRVFCAEV